MKFSLTLVVIFLFGTVFSVEEEDKVLVLEDKTFDEEIKKHDYLLIEFYAPWCGHCKSLAPEYAKAAEELRNENPPLYLAKVDATANEGLATRFNVEGYPTLKFYSQGEYKDYNGGRTHEEIVSWVKKRTTPPSKELVTLEETQVLLRENEVVCLFFGSSDSQEYKLFVKVAEKFDDVKFAHTSNEQLFQFYDVKLGQVLLLTDFGLENRKFPSDFTVESLEHFIIHYSVPLVSKFNDKMADLIFSKNQVGFFYVRSSENAEQTKLDPVITTFAEKYRGKIIFVVTDIVGELEEQFAEYIGVTQTNLPVMRIMNVKGEEDVTTYAMTKEMTESNIDQFLQDFMDDKLEPYLKSEEVPTEQTGPVMKVVGKNFNEVVLQSDKNIFMLFYAPWCGHCQELHPKFEQLANHFTNETNMIFAQVDSTANDIDGLTIDGYPTLKFYPAQDKSNPIDYTGGRTYEDLEKFVNRQLYPEKFAEETNNSQDDQALPVETQESNTETKADL